MGNRLHIWIDLDNSPHVPFFIPIIRELRRKGHSITITARDCFQTCDLIDLSGLEYTKIGHHYGKRMLFKATGLLIRGLQLYFFGRNRDFSVAVSHGSRSLFVAAFLLKIPLVNMFDYEYSRFGLLPDAHTKQLVPDLLPDETLSQQLDLSTVVKYPGLKEEIYIKDFHPDESFLEKLKIDYSKVLITIRPPASEAHYHNPESETLFASVCRFLYQNPNVVVVILPRTVKQKKHILKLARDNRNAQIKMPSKVLNGLDLIWYSDLVISGGGTMNREAALLGVPAYSIFRGKTPSVDKFLQKEEKLQLITCCGDFSKIKVEKRRRPSHPRLIKNSLVTIIAQEIVSSALKK